MKRTISCLVMALLVCTALGLFAGGTAEAASDFVVENGVLTKYNGSGGNVVIPSNLGITRIGEYAFASGEYDHVGGMMANTKITGVVIPKGVTAIEACAFYRCTKLTSATIPDSVTYIGDRAFQACSLSSISIPKGVTYIGIFAFSQSKFTSVVIPDGVTSIKTSTFDNCHNLTSVSIPDSVTSIESYAFSSCRSLTSLNIPDSVTSIGSSAFTGAGLRSISIPDSVIFIDGSAFSYCENLTSAIIPESVESIGPYAFNNCPNLTISCYMGSSAYNYAVANDIEYKLLNTSEYVVNDGVLTAYLGKGGAVVIPSNLGITEIGSRAFEDNLTITSVVIPKGVTEIGNNAFSGCSNLKKVTFPDGLTRIEDEAFYNCDLQSIDLPDSMTYVGWDCFANNESVTRLVIPGGMRIDCGAFSSSDNLTTVIINAGDEAIYIDESSFAFCPKLTSITIPGNVTRISEWAFDGSDNVTIYCHSDSAAHEFAIEYGVRYQLISDAYLTVSHSESHTSTGAARESFTVKTKKDVSAIGMYSEGGALVKKYSGSSYYTDSGDVRTWKFSYDFTNDGKRTMTFKALASDGSVLTSTAYAMNISGLKVHSAAFSASSAEKGKTVTATVKTNTGAKYLHMYSEGGAAVKKWDAAACSKVSGAERIWTISYAFSGAGSRTITFKASKDGQSGVGTGKAAKITITEKAAVTSAEFTSTVAYTKQQVTAKVKTSSDAKYLHMYGEGGAQITKWAASGNSTVSGSVRTWTVKYTFSGKGSRTMTFKASKDGTNVGSGKSATILITSGAPAVSSAAFGKSSALKGESVSITVKTNADATKLRMYSENGAAAKTWSASGNSTVNGTERIWKVSYSFGGEGSRSLTFKATKDGSTMGAGKTAKITIKKNVNVTSAEFTSTVAYTRQQVTAKVKTGSDAKYLHMYGEGGAQITKWAASGNSTVSGNVRTWTVKYTFSGAGSRTMTFKGSADGKNVGSGKSATILIANSAPAVSSAAFGKSSAAKGESVSITVKTNADATKLRMYSENGAAAKTWSASGNSTVNGTERIWRVSYSFNGAGNRSLTFKATKDGSTMGAGKTVKIAIK